MSKKYDKASKRSQYDDYEEEERFYGKKKPKNKKKDIELEFVNELDVQKQKANNRYLNKKRDKDKYNKQYDDWN